MPEILFFFFNRWTENGESEWKRLMDLQEDVAACGCLGNEANPSVVNVLSCFQGGEGWLYIVLSFLSCVRKHL